MPIFFIKVSKIPSGTKFRDLIVKSGIFQICDSWSEYMKNILTWKKVLKNHFGYKLFLFVATHFFFYHGFLSRTLTTYRTAGPLPPTHEHSDIYFATLHVRWLSHISNRTACIYQAATRWDLPPYWITIWLIDYVMLTFVCLLVDLIQGFCYSYLTHWKPLNSNSHRLSSLYYKLSYCSHLTELLRFLERSFSISYQLQGTLCFVYANVILSSAWNLKRICKVYKSWLQKPWINV